MKNNANFIICIIFILCITFITCQEPDEELLPVPKGYLTINGFPEEYNGKNVWILINISYLGYPVQPNTLIGAIGAKDSSYDNTVFNLAKIHNNAAVIPLYIVTDNRKTVKFDSCDMNGEYSYKIFISVIDGIYNTISIKDAYSMLLSVTAVFLDPEMGKSNIEIDDFIYKIINDGYFENGSITLDWDKEK